MQKKSHVGVRLKLYIRRSRLEGESLILLQKKTFTEWSFFHTHKQKMYPFLYPKGKSKTFPFYFYFGLGQM